MTDFTQSEADELVKSAREHVQGIIDKSGKDRVIWLITEWAQTLAEWEDIKADIKKYYDIDLPDLFEGVTAVVSN